MDMLRGGKIKKLCKPYISRVKKWITGNIKAQTGKFIAKSLSPVKPYASKIKAWAADKFADAKLVSISSKQLGILLMLIIFFATGWMGNIHATASQETIAAATVKAQKVLLNGKVAGYVCGQESAQIIMNEILNDASENYGMEVTAGNRLVFEQVDISPEMLSTKEELQSSLRRLADIKVNACVLYVDGEKLGTLKSEEDVQQLLDSIKSQYAEGISNLENVSFREIVEIVPTSVEFHEVQDVKVIEAKIKEGQETVDEYIVKEGDTFWSIAKAFHIDPDELLKLNSNLEPEKLQLGQKIRLSSPKSLLNVVTTEIIEYEEPVPFETETQKDSSMFSNESKVIQNGEEGLKRVEARVIKVNGTKEKTEIISEQVIKEPVNKIVMQGTKTPVSKGSGSFAWPTRGSLSSRYGRRWGRLHKGIDIANSRGTPVYAADSGKVIFSGWHNGGYGNLIQIDHGNGIVTYYAHLSKRVVSSGSSVSKGDLIGYIGNTGRSTGPHLHFEVRVNGSPRNPLNYLP